MRRFGGIGTASREYIRALRGQGVNTRVANAKDRSSTVTKRRKILVYHFSPATLNLKIERSRYGRVIVNTVWETSRVPSRWVPKINGSDAVCVPSLQNKRAMRNSGVKVPVFVVPHGVNLKSFHPNNKKLSVQNTAGKFIFVSVFGFQHRKNPEALLRAYWEEFSASDNVHLVIKTSGYAPYENARWIHNRVKAYKKRLGIRKATAPVTIIANRLSPKQLRGIYTLGSAFVLPTRGEGFGLPFLESLASGTPVIATRWGGHMDFLNHRNAFLVSYTLRHPTALMNRSSSISRQFRGLFSGKGQRWAEPNINSLRRQMRIAYQNPRLCKAKGKQGRRDALQHSWNQAGRSLKRAIETVIRTK